MIIDPATGAFCLGGLAAGPRTTSDELVRHFGAALATSPVGAWVHHRRAPIVVDGERYHVTYLCEGGLLRRIELVVWDASSAPPTFADPWNPAKAEQERAVYEAWLTRRLGTQRVFPWGSVSAVFDVRSTVSFIGIRYEADV